MQAAFSSTLLLTLLLAIGLMFFLRAASKDRTTVVDIHSSLPEIDVLKGLTAWLEQRGWTRKGGDLERKTLVFNGNVASSKSLAIFLSLLGGLGAASLGLVLSQLYPYLGWWPLCLSILGAPLTGFIYTKKSSRMESLEMRLLTINSINGTDLRIRAHRDELIAIELELGERLDLSSDGSLLSSPI